MELLKAKNAIVHLGGAGTMATQIVSNARSAGLDITYDFRTLGNGNCFTHPSPSRCRKLRSKSF